MTLPLESDVNNPVQNIQYDGSQLYTLLIQSQQTAVLTILISAQTPAHQAAKVLLYTGLNTEQKVHLIECWIFLGMFATV